MDRLISIILCTYNGEQFLGQQLDSIFDQTYKKMEVLVCDDQSTDRTVPILKGYQSRQGLRYIVNRMRLGFVKNFEKALSLAKGDLIALSDQDDIWERNKIEILEKEIGRHTLICSDSRLIDDEGREIHGSFREYASLQVPCKHQFESLLFHNFVQGATALFKRSLLEKALPIPHNMMFHDWWLALVASRLEGIKYLPTSLIKYRLHGKNESQVVDARSIFRLFFTYLRNRRLYRRFIEKQILQLMDLKNQPLFKEDQKAIDRAIAYHRSLLSWIPHLKAFSMSVKYRKIIYPTMHNRLYLAMVLRNLLG